MYILMKNEKLQPEGQQSFNTNTRDPSEEMPGIRQGNDLKGRYKQNKYIVDDR